VNGPRLTGPGATPQAPPAPQSSAASAIRPQAAVDGGGKYYPLRNLNGVLRSAHLVTDTAEWGTGAMGAALMGIVAVLLAALLVIAVDAAGGWRRIRPATAADQALARPATDPAGLDSRIWQARTVAAVLQLVLVVTLGLTPLGARLVHLVAPNGDTWHAASAWLLILASLAVARLPVLWWRRQMRRTRPELFRPRGGPRQRLARAAMIAVRLVSLVLWVFALVLDIRRQGGAYLGLSLALVVTTWLLVLIRRIRIQRLPRSDRLSDIVSSLPGDPRIPVVSGWPGAVANATVVGFGRPVIQVAPPIAAALTDRELRPVLAHEVAHVRHHDARRRRLRRLLMGLCVLAAMVALYGIPALRSLAGLRGRLSAQAGPFLLAVWYLVFRILYAMELRATRAEELAADRDMVALTGDPDACADGLARLSSLLGVPDVWTLPQRLLFATHPATIERLSLLRETAPLADAQPRGTTASRVVWRWLLAGVLVLGAVVAVGAVPDHGVHRVIVMPADAGRYQVLLPRNFDTAPLDTTDTAQLRSSVWGSGDLTRFPGAVPVAAVYYQDGQLWFYAWGAYGKLADPSGELSAFWNKFPSFPDAEPTGPLGGYLQCDDGTLTCAWADNSGIVVVSLAGPAQLGSPVITYAGPEVTEQEVAAMTLSLRAAAEVPARRRHIAS
jgi:Zn-dependent protease with chaperone function